MNDKRLYAHEGNCRGWSQALRSIRRAPTQPFGGIAAVWE